MRYVSNNRILLGMVGALSLVVFTAGAPRVSRADRVTVTVDAVNVRKGPGTRFAKIHSAKRGQTYEVVGRKRNWVQIRIGERTGWASGRFFSRTNRPATKLDLARGGRDAKSTAASKAGPYAEPTGTTTAVAAGTIKVVNASRLNLRKRPGGAAPVVGKLVRGTRVTVVAGRGGWREVTAGGRRGWVFGKFLRNPRAGKPGKVRRAKRKGKKVAGKRGRVRRAKKRAATRLRATARARKRSPGLRAAD